MSSSGALLAKMVRLPLSLIPCGAEVRVLRGPLRGMRWIKGSGPNACWFGTYEVSRLRTFANLTGDGVEGAELEVLEGCDRLVAEFHPTIFFEIHGTQLHADCRAFLSKKGYRIDEGRADHSYCWIMTSFLLGYESAPLQIEWPACRVVGGGP